MRHIFIIILSTTFLAAQTGSIVGKVIDKSSNEALAGANVVLLGEGLGDASDMDGVYEIVNVPVGSYQIKITVIGYKPLVKNRVVVKPGIPTVLNIEMEEDVFSSEEVVVRPSFFESVKDAPVSSMTMDYSEISIQPGGLADVQRAVQALPSLVTSSDNDNEIIVRGGNSGENLMLIDNIEIPNPNHLANETDGGGPISALYVDFVERIDFIAGAFPAKFGGKASSVMDVRLREGLRDGLHLKLDLSMAGAGGNIEGPVLDGKGSFMIAGHKSFLKLILPEDNMPEYWNTQGKFVYDFNPRLKLSAFGMLAGDYVDYLSKDDPEIEEDSLSMHLKTDQYAVGITLRSVMNNAIGRGTIFSTRHSWGRNQADVDDVELAHSYTTETVAGGKTDWMIFIGDKHEIGLGAEVKYIDNSYDMFEENDTIFDYSADPDTAVAVNGYDFKNNPNAIGYGVYAQLQSKIGRRVSTNIGFRYDGFSYNNGNYLSPRASISYKLTEVSDLSAALGRHYQAPPGYMIGFNADNSTLDHYFTDQIVMGFAHLFREDVRGSVEGYYKRYHGYPIQRSSITEDPLDTDLSYVNAVDGYARGVEFFLQKKVKKNLWGTLSYSLSEAINEDPRADNCLDSENCPYGEYPKDFDFRHVFNGILGYRVNYLDKKWYRDLKGKPWFWPVCWIPGAPSDEGEYSVRLRYLGGRPYTRPVYYPDYRTWLVEPGQEFNQDRMPAYTSLDIHLQSRWYFGRWTLFTYIMATNILDRENVWTYLFNSDGSVETIEQMPTMVIGGIIVEF